MKRPGHSNERGSVLVIVAVTLTALLGMGMIVVDVANWWVHKRHLQGQVDAAALAGAQLLRGPCTTAVTNLVANEVQRYAGTTALIPGAVTGQQLSSQISLGGGESVLGVLNSRGYPDSQAGGSADTEANTGNPCADSAVDVKLTDKNIPYLFLGGALPHVNVHARVGLLQAGDVTGVLPFAVPDPTPQTVVARLVNDNGTALPGTGDITLTQQAPGTDPGQFASASQTVPVPAGNSNSTAVNGASTGDYSQPAVNVRIAASGNPGTISAGCTGPGETCYPSPSSLGGLIQLRAWPQHNPTAKDVAVIHGVQLSQANGNCGNDGYFMRIPVTAGSCAVTVTVTADFQAGVTLPTIGAAPAGSDKAGICMITNSTQFVTSNPSGNSFCGNGASQLTRGVDVNGHATWTGQVPVTTNENTATSLNARTFISVWGVAQQGSVTFTNSQQCNSGNQNPCVQSPIPAQEIFSGSLDISGYLDAVQAVGVTDPYNRSQCFSSCTLTTQFAAHFQQLKPAANANDRLFALHLSASQNNQTIDCGDGSNTRTMIANGCQNPFRQWTSSDPAWSSINGYGPPIAPPYPCVESQPGTAAGPVGQGMQQRILGGGACQDQYRNHWSQYPWTADPSVPLNDRRLVPVFITRFGGFANAPNGSGNFFPVTGFALFYVTGWSGNGSNDDPCTSGTPIAGSTLDDTPATSGTIVGHFVNLVDEQFTPDPGSTPCDLRTLSICAPVLTD